MQIGTRRVAIAMLAMVGLVSGCGAVDVSVTLRNDAIDGQPIHILRPGEAFAASNQITPGSTRSVVVGYETEGSGVEFRAGRNGEVLSTVMCVSQNIGAISDFNLAIVIWDGLTLRCEGWDG